MKINWGTKLVFFALLFMIFVMSMVFVITQQDIPLVDNNYYEKGLNYQQEIDNSKGIDSLIQLEVVRVPQLAKGPVLMITKKLGGIVENATLKFYRPSDPALDRKSNIQLNTGAPMMWPLDNLTGGKWIVSLSWKENEMNHEVKMEFER